MDKDTEKREQGLDQAYERLKVELMEDKERFSSQADKLETRVNMFREDLQKNATPDELEKSLTATDKFLTLQSTHALAQVFRLAERMITELQHVYAANYSAFKAIGRVERELPDGIRADLEKAIELYQKRLTENTRDMVKDAVSFTISGIFEPRDSYEEKRERRNDTGKSG